MSQAMPIMIYLCPFVSAFFESLLQPSEHFLISWRKNENGGNFVAGNGRDYHMQITLVGTWWSNHQMSLFEVKIHEMKLNKKSQLYFHCNFFAPAWTKMANFWFTRLRRQFLLKIWMEDSLQHLRTGIKTPVQRKTTPLQELLPDDLVLIAMWCDIQANFLSADGCSLQDVYIHCHTEWKGCAANCGI